MHLRFLLFSVVVTSTFLLPSHATFPGISSSSSNHTSNWAVLVATSKYWYNYRHIANTLSFYRTVKRLGIPDSNIILMLAEDVACNARNAYPSQVFNDESHSLNVYGSNVEVDYRGYEVTVENFMRVLTGRHDPAVPRPKRLLSDSGSNVLVYISGHGGNEFMKFQDIEELMAQDVADAIAQMHSKGRYTELLLVVETCQAATLYSRIRSPNVLAMASSLKDESSYSYGTDVDVGLSLIDRFTWSTLDFFEGVGINSQLTLADLVKIYTFEKLDSTFHYDVSNYRRPLHQVPVTDFFGSVTAIQATADLRSTAGDLAAAAATAAGGTGPSLAAAEAGAPVAAAGGHAPAAGAGAAAAGAASSSSQTQQQQQLLVRPGLCKPPHSSSCGAVVPPGVYWGLAALAVAVSLAAALQHKQSV